MSRLPIIGFSARFKAPGRDALAGHCPARCHASRVGLSSSAEGSRQRQVNAASLSLEVTSATVYSRVRRSFHVSPAADHAPAAVHVRSPFGMRPDDTPVIDLCVSGAPCAPLVLRLRAKACTVEGNPRSRCVVSRRRMGGLRLSAALQQKLCCGGAIFP